jgi:HlyD family secretion protein
MTTKKKVIGGIGLVCTLFLTLGLVFDRSASDPESFTWEVVSRGDLRETIQASGEIQAKTRINIGTNVAGEIKGIHVRDGEDVKAGQLLVTIDQERVRQQLFQVEAVLDAARKDAARMEAATRRAHDSAARTRKLYEQGLVAEENYRQAALEEESAELSYAAAKANITQNQANVAAMRDGLVKTVLVAPIAGRVTALRAEMGEMAIPGMSNLPGATLMVISDMSEMNAEIKVNESEVVRLKVGQTVQVAVESLPGRLFAGKVYEIASTAEETGQNANLYNVKVALDMHSTDAALLRPGMSARGVVLTADVKNAIRVPLQSVLERDGTLDEAASKGLFGPETRSVVMVLNKGKAHERIVTTGIANTQFNEIKSGLAAGDKVLTGPSRKLKELKDGTAVTPRKLSDTEAEKKAEAQRRASEES